jgi:predicted small lipoprotein YifL
MHRTKALIAVPDLTAIPLCRAPLYGARTSETLMPSSSPFPGRTLVIAGLIALSLAACGRRGALEAPLTPAELAAQQQGQQRQAAAAGADDDELGNATVRTPVPTTRRRSRAYTIPQEPFILDPLL